MRGYIFLFFIILLSPDRVIAQKDSTGYYTIRIKEQVQADYSNLLDTGKVRNFREVDKFYKWTVIVKKISDSIFFLQLKPDSLLENGVQSLSSTYWLQFLFRTGMNEPFGAALYSDKEVTAPLMNLVKILISNIPFVLRSNLPEYEPYIDGVFKSVYSMKKEKGGGIVLHKRKEVVYPPGIHLFRNSIDSFKAEFIYEQGSALLRSGNCYEEKKQKMGSRMLSTVKTLIEITPIEKNISLPAVAGNYSDIYDMQIPIFRKINYSERIRRQSVKYEPIFSLGTLLQTATEIHEDAAGRLTARIRSSLLRNEIAYAEVKSMLDSVETSSIWFRILEDALVESGTSQAQDILTDMLERKREKDIFYKRLLVKIGVTAPIVSNRLLESLIELKKDTTRVSLSSAAGLALSNNAFLMIDEGMLPERKKILDELQNNFRRSVRHKKDTIQWLQEAGNSANDSVLLLVTDCFQQQDIDLKEEALYALRFISGSVTDSLIAMQLSIAFTEFPETVIDVLRMRYPSAIIRQALYTCFQSGRPLQFENTKEFIDYLLSWKDEVKAISAELVSINLTDKEVISYIKRQF